MRDLFIPKPLDVLTDSEADSQRLRQVGHLLVNIGVALIENGPVPGKVISEGSTESDLLFIDDPKFTELYNNLSESIEMNLDSVTYDSVYELYLSIKSFEESDFVEEFEMCRLSIVFEYFCPTAHTIMYLGDMNEETDYLISECDWSELDAIIYTYLEYCDRYDIVIHTVDGKTAERTIQKLPVEVAKKWYIKGGDFRKVALQFYTENALT